MPESWLTMRDLQKMFAGRSRASIYRDIERGHLPKPTKMGQVNFWPESKLNAHLERRSPKNQLPPAAE